MLSLIVTADDFGIGLETSKGIIRAHLQGPVTATSLMVVTGDHVRASIPLLADAPNLDVGLHLVLTRCGEKPLVATRSSGLVDRGGEFFTNGKLWLRAFAGKLDRDGVADEITAQAELFQKLMGRSPDYVDGHHHSHQLPTVRESLVEVMNRGLLPTVTRITIEADSIRRDVSGVKLKRTAANFVGSRAACVFSKSGVRTNDSFFGMLAADDLLRPFPWDRYLAALPDTGVVEWVVHPGLPDHTLIDRDDYKAERAAELAALTGNPAAWEKLKSSLSRKSGLKSLAGPS